MIIFREVSKISVLLRVMARAKQRELKRRTGKSFVRLPCAHGQFTHLTEHILFTGTSNQTPYDLQVAGVNASVSSQWGHSSLNGKDNAAVGGDRNVLSILACQDSNS